MNNPTAEKMDTIINVQLIQEKVYGLAEDVDVLNSYDVEVLRKIVQDLIPLYNKIIQNETQKDSGIV